MRGTSVICVLVVSPSSWSQGWQVGNQMMLSGVGRAKALWRRPEGAEAHPPRTVTV